MGLLIMATMHIFTMTVMQQAAESFMERKMISTLFQASIIRECILKLNDFNGMKYEKFLFRYLTQKTNYKSYIASPDATLFSSTLTKVYKKMMTAR